MAADMFLKIDGIAGESEDQKHGKEIEVVSWGWSMSNSGVMPAGGGTSKVSVQDLSITKNVDASSHALIQACCSGKHFKDATLVVRKTGVHHEYLKIEMTDMRVSQVQSGGDGRGGLLTETISLNFSKFKFTYYPQKKDGSADAGKEMNWTINPTSKA